jgi:hypothetical protein
MHRSTLCVVALAVCLGASALFVSREHSGQKTARSNYGLVSPQVDDQEVPLRQDADAQLAESKAHNTQLESATPDSAISAGAQTVASEDPAHNLSGSDVDLSDLVQWPESAARQELLRRAGRELASNEIAEVLEILRSLPDKARETVTLAFSMEAARTAPREALTALSELPEGPRTAEAISHAASQWGAMDPESAADWAVEFGAGQLGDQVVGGIATQWAERDAKAAARFALENLPTGNAKERACVAIAQRWVQTEPSAALAWIEQFPAGSLQNAAIEAVLPLWARRDAAKSASWVHQIKDANLSALALRIHGRVVAVK